MTTADLLFTEIDCEGRPTSARLPLGSLNGRRARLVANFGLTNEAKEGEISETVSYSFLPPTPPASAHRDVTLVGVPTTT